MEKKRYFFVDYKSVENTGLNGIEKVNENDEIVIFYSEKNSNLSFDSFRKLGSCSAEINMINLDNCTSYTAEAMAVYISYTLGSSPDNTCYILTFNQSSFKSMFKLLEDKNLSINYFYNFAEALKEEN